MVRVIELAKRRRSVRSFRPEPIPMRDVEYVLEVGRNAPSGANRQPWKFLVITDDSVKEEVRRRCEEVERGFHGRAPEELKNWFRERRITWRKPFLSEAPVLILVFGRRGEPYWVQSVWLAIGYMVLAAEELGYATLTYTPSETRWANALFGVPDKYILQAIIPVGKPAEAPKHPGRLSLNEVAYLESWGLGFKEA